MNHVIDVVVGIINSIGARDLNHRLLNKLEDETDASGLPYHNEFRWLSRELILKRFHELRSTMRRFYAWKRKGCQVAEEQ